ncbi:MAG: glycosyltransferase family A protein [Betaproteobacteria bacterium]
MMASMARSRPSLTIVIPTLNRARLVARAVESALAQTAPDIEIIVSDNGSADETPAVLARYRDDRLRHIRHECTIPATDHGNFLLDQASGEFFLGLSDDDYIEPEFVDRVLEHFRRHKGLAFVYTGCITHYGSVAVPGITGPETEGGSDFISAFFAGKREVCWCACVARMADLRAIGPIPERRVFGDMFFWTKLAFRGSVGCVATHLAHYTFMTTDNVSSGTPVLTWALETRMLADEVLAAYGDLGGDLVPAGLRRDCVRFVARSTANQFVWNAIRGSGKPALLAALPACLPYVSGDPSVWPRIAGALAMPRRVIRDLILKAAARRASLHQRLQRR